MSILNALSIPPAQFQAKKATIIPTWLKFKADYLILVVLAICITTISTVMHNPLLVEILLFTFIATSFEQRFLLVVEHLKKNLRIRQLVIGVGVAALIVSLGMHPAYSQAAPGGGLFNPLSQQTNSVLTQAGAGQAGNSILGIFTLMNIIVTIAGVGAVVYGAYQQSQGHTLRESFTPLALVLIVYIGCSFVMRMFLGTAA